MEIKNKYRKQIYELLDKYEEYYESEESRLEVLKTNKQLYQELLSYLSEDPENIKENKIIISLLLTTIYPDEKYLKLFYSSLINLDQIRKDRTVDKKIDEGYDYKTVKENKQKEFNEDNSIFETLIFQITNDSQKNENELISLTEQLRKNRNLCRISKRGKRCLYYGWPINKFKYDIVNIKRILIFFQEKGVINNKELILLINEIETYNRRLLTKYNKYNKETEKDYTERKYNEVINIINAGFSEPPKVEVLPERKPTLDKMVKEITQYISYQDTLEITKDIEKYRKYNLEDNEYNYILVKLLDYYIEQLLGLQELLKDSEVFVKYRDRLEIIKSYYTTLELYVIILKYYDEVNKVTEVETPSEVTQENSIDENIETPRKLIYATAPSNVKKARIVSDMDDIPKEYYDKIAELLSDFKARKKDKKIIKYLDSKKGKTNLELKDDQVRIIIKRLKEDIYIVIGAFAKKSNNDQKAYDRITNRVIPKIDTETKMQIYLTLSEKVEIELTEKIKREGRKGTR